MAGMRKLRGKYYIRVWIDQKEKLLPTGTGIKRDAERLLHRVQAQEIEVKLKLREEIDGLNQRLTIKEGISFFERNIGKERNLQESSVKSYKLATKNFQDCLGHFGTFDALKKQHYTNLVKYLQKHFNNTTVNIRLRGIRAMLNYLLEKEMITKLPFNVKQIKTDKALPKFITPDEMVKIYKQVTDERLAAVFRVYEATGMRVGELKNSHRKGEFVFIDKSKNRKARIIPIPLERIPDYDLAKELDWSVSWISHNFSVACTDAGFPGKTIHALRHTFALRKLIELNNISLVKELLGHSSVKVTEIYTQFPKQFLSQIFIDRKVNQTASVEGVTGQS